MAAAADQDSPWKEALTSHTRLAFALLFPEVNDLDWSRDHEVLEQELRKLWPDDEVGKRVADVLIKAFTLESDERYFHIEVQGRPQEEFGDRAFT